jgi:hypothetical protein
LGDKSDPRNPANDWFVSGNVGAYPPTGTFTRPISGTIVGIGDNPILDVTATTDDDVDVIAVQLLAKLNDQWVEIGPLVTQPASPDEYDWDVDLCAAAPINGPLEVALRVWDHEGNVADVLDPRTIQVDHACPPPASQLNPAETFDSTAVHLSWDAVNVGAGIASFDLQWRAEPGEWDANNVFTFTADTQSTWFAGQPGNSYAFRLRARDENQQPEPWPDDGAFEIDVTFPLTCIPDIFEPDDVITQTRQLPLGEWAQGNLCEAGDPDWFQVEIAEPGDYFVNAHSVYGGAAVTMTVYTVDGATILASGQSAEIGQGALVRFQAAEAGSYYVKVDPFTPTLMGTEAVYGIRASEVKNIFLPVVAR